MRFNQKEFVDWRMDIQPRMIIIPTLIFAICCYLGPPSVTARHTYTHTHTHTKSKERGSARHMRCWGRTIRSPVGHILHLAIPYLEDRFYTCASLSYLPVLVRTIIALAQHLKDDSTAPTATASEGSLVSWECLLSSSNSCLWKMAASASRAIWAQRDHGERSGGYSQSHTLVIHTTGKDWQITS